MQSRECIVSERTRDTEQRFHEPCACLWVPCSSRLAFAAYAYGRAFARWNFLLHAAKQNTLNIRGLEYEFSEILSLLIRPLNFTQNDERNFGQKHELQYLEKFAM